MTDIQKIMRVIDDAGAIPMPVPEWIGLLEEIMTECESRLEAARDDLSRAPFNATAKGKKKR